MRRFANIIFAAFTILCAGCGTVGMHIFPDSTNPVYGGTRHDCHILIHTDDPALTHVASFVDLPFSLVGDTLLLPFDVTDWIEVSRPDPLKDWSFKPFPTGSLGNITTNTLDKAIVDDYQNFIKKNGLSIMGTGITGYVEDGKGQRGVKFEAFYGNESWDYALIYDNRNKRVKTVRFNRSRYMC